ncbi:MAG: transglutaminase-like domain-containing protein [Pseudomonadota bacterium]
MDIVDAAYLSPTLIIDSDHPTIIEYANDITGAAGHDAIDRAVKLYYAVRDDIWYDPYYPFYLPEHYRASNVLKSGRGFCVSKISLLCALGRAVNIPARAGFATVRNHLATERLLEYLGSDLFVYHGFTEFFLDGKWVKATPAFNIELCRKHHVIPLDFNGREDSIFHEYNSEKKQFMEYVEYHGSYADIPLETILSEWRKAYGGDRVDQWIRDIEALAEKSDGDNETA